MIKKTVKIKFEKIATLEKFKNFKKKKLIQFIKKILRRFIESMNKRNGPVYLVK